MAEESEKKQAFVVHKKQADTPVSNAAANANAAKKKVVVVKKRAPGADAPAAKPDNAKKEGVRVVVKKPEGIQLSTYFALSLKERETQVFPF